MEPSDDSAVQRLRAKTGRGVMECRAALEICEMDEELARGYLAFNGLAVSIKPLNGESRTEAYRRWVMTQAYDYAASLAKGT